MLSTVVIKTFLRSGTFERTLQALRQKYPSMPVIVMDDGDDDKAPIAKKYDVQYQKYEFDLGWGACWLQTISKITTPYFFAFDDDFVCNDETELKLLLEPLKKDQADLVGGGVRHRNGKLTAFTGAYTPDTIYPVRPISAVKVVSVDYTVLFFAARTSYPWRWDDRLKFAKHMDFFISNAWQGKYPHITKRDDGARYMYDPRCVVYHNNPGFKGREGVRYRHYRVERYQAMRKQFLEKWGFPEQRDVIT